MNSNPISNHPTSDPAMQKGHQKNLALKMSAICAVMQPLFRSCLMVGLKRFWWGVVQLSGLYLRLCGRAFGAYRVPAEQLLERLGVFLSLQFCPLVSSVVRAFLLVKLSTLLSILLSLLA